MAFADTLRQADELQQRIHAHGRLPDDVLRKINYKFRLEWNYHSNRMEGNTLTREETRSVMVGNIQVDKKPLKDLLEVKGHDDVINQIIKMGRGELNVSEKRIKEIHRAIMHEDEEEKRSQIGEWKAKANEIINYKHEKYNFAPPGEVRERVHKLVDWLNAQRDKIKSNTRGAVHPAELAFRFHLDYLTIHPFYDGNGRTGRILMNLILIAYGFPPVYITDQEKETCYRYLADIQGYGGDPDLYLDFMAGLLIRSQELVLDAIAGKDIEEPDDVLKEIALWKKQLGTAQVLPRSNARIAELYKEAFSPMLDRYLHLMKDAFGDVFTQWEEIGMFNRGGSGRQGKSYIDGSIRRVETDILHPVISPAQRFGEESVKAEEIYSIGMNLYMRGFTRDGLNAFDIHPNLSLEFDEYQYRVQVDGRERLAKLYSQTITEAEQADLVRTAVKETFERIKQQVKSTNPEAP